MSLAACIDHPDAPNLPAGSEQVPSGKPTGGEQHTSTPAAPKPPAPQELKDPKSVLTEVVYVLFKDWDGGDWMCTGTLVAADTVVSAAHCLNESRFTSWRVIAPLAKDRPEANVAWVAAMTDDADTIANPDIGFLKLEQGIDLPAYAKLTDLSNQIEKGDKLTALAIVREHEEHEAPFKVVSGLKIASTTAKGYDHGFGTQLFSKGGDSGAGLFLVENGQVTHKLIGIARQPEPDTETDHFTRIDSTFFEWFRENGGE